MNPTELEQRRLENETIVDEFEKDLKALLARYPGVLLHHDGHENVRILFCRRSPFVSRVFSVRENS